ncbi:MAG: hypothetical protein SOW78_01855 [Clostridia bacterium]|nr:hypothetical protein [Clostridia bacterium]
MSEKDIKIKPKATTKAVPTAHNAVSGKNTTARDARRQTDVLSAKSAL